ncbi:MAG TPA: PGPGW domain-containing protein [Acidimicrobiia bacterium]|nr:PGPGW domain-containing protein [Acidimicrobiia bacterium]
MRRVANVLGGFTLVIAGVAMLVLPGPGVLTIFGGLTLLGYEFHWARRLVDGARARAGSVLNRVTKSERDQAGG